jgi:hypothetical protein
MSAEALAKDALFAPRYGKICDNSPSVINIVDARAFSIPIESERWLYYFILTRFS